VSGLVSSHCLERAARLAVQAGRAAAGRGAGDRAAAIAGVGTAFLDHRTYTAGDDLRYVDWNAWGRLRSLYLKVFELEENLDLHLLVDRTASMGNGPGSKLRSACRAAALVGAAALAHGDTVRLQFLPSVRGDDRLSGARAFRGRSATPALVQALDTVEAGKREPLGRVLRDAFPRLRRRGFALLLTDFMDAPDADASEGDRGWRYAVDFLTYRRVALTAIQVIAEEERDPLVVGPLRLTDAETGEQIDVFVTEQLLDEYRRMFRRGVREVSAYLRSKQAHHVILDTAQAQEDALLRVLLEQRVLA
jgi:uncharacterized protein (DUF58 family)